MLTQVKTGGYFTEAEAQREWQTLWFAAVNAPTPAAFLEARASLTIGDPGLTLHWSTTLYEYVLKEWLIEGMQEKHCRAWTNKILHFGKLTTSTAESGHWGIKQGLESSLEDLATVVQSIHTKLDDKLQEIHLHHEDQKSGAMLAAHNAPIFRYLRFEVSINAIEYMFLQWEQLTKESTCLPHCTRVFRTTMGLPCKHELQEFLYAKEPLKRDHLHPHWWLDPLVDARPVDSLTVVQTPIQVRQRGRLIETSTR